jgi:Site-specific recombinase XerD
VIDEARRVAIPGITARNRDISDSRGRALFAALSSMFSWLKRQRRVESNPCAGVHRPAGPQARDRVLTADEIRWFWRACESVDAPLAPGAPRPFGPLLKVLLLTGQRRNEVAGMTRDELSDDGATWNIPGSRTKNGRAHVVPLPPLVRELIASVRAKPGNLVFTTTGTTAVSGWSRMKGRLDAAMLAAAREEGRAVIPPWTLHDLRRTFVTGMVELRVPPHVVEVTVNHIGGTRSGVAGIYNRSELMDERKEALERWATHVAGIVTSSAGEWRQACRESGGGSDRRAAAVRPDPIRPHMRGSPSPDPFSDARVLEPAGAHGVPARPPQVAFRTQKVVDVVSSDESVLDFPKAEITSEEKARRAMAEAKRLASLTRRESGDCGSTAPPNGSACPVPLWKG